MNRSKSLFRLQHIFLASVASLGLCAEIVTSAVAADAPASKDEPARQSGNIFVKFKVGVSDAKIQEVADHYGARQVMPLNSSESSSHKNDEQWRKLKFESVSDLKDLARRIFQDNRVDEVE